MKELLKDRAAKRTAVGAAISLIGLIVYIVLYGTVQRSMDSMSWQAVWALGVGLALAAALFALKKYRWAAPVLAAAHFVSFLFYIYGMYPYISAAFVGIDSTWEVDFFVTLALYLVGLVVNIAAAFAAVGTVSRLCKPLALVMAVLCGVSVTGGVIANENAPQINGVLNTPPFRTTDTGDGSEDTEYFKSDFSSLEELIAAGQALGEEAMAEGAVLLKNENDALPLTGAERNVSLFGIGSVDPVYGGTGSGVSPMIGKFVSDNVNIPVIMVGVYPSLSEDATAQYNAMTWQDEVIRTGLPYMIFDNEIGGNGNKIRVHGIINSAIANVMKVISGDVFGDTNISMIDSMDMWMLLQNTGKRIVIALSDKKPTTGQTLDDYVLHMIKECHQPVPVNTKGIGIFVKGPKDMISSLDTSMSGVREVYGDAVVQYSHIEESDKVSIAIIMSGNSEPEERLYMMKSRYDDITNSQKEDVSSVASILGTMSNPIGGIKRSKKETIEPDLSALDF